MTGSGGPAVVRTATLADGPLVAGLRRDWTEELAGTAIEDDGFDEAFASWFESEHPRRLTWLAQVAGEAVGMLNMLVFTRMPRPRPVGGPAGAAHWGYVANVYVAPAVRDHGVGRQLLDAAITHADDQGFARVVLSPSERSVPFYERAGFVPAVSLMVRQ